MKPVEHYLPEETIGMLRNQQYALFGHSAAKLCHWTKEALYKNRFCYKHLFYGIQSHRCIQMSPSVVWCQQQCGFCWRPLSTIGTEMKEFDDPKEIVEQSIEKQRMLLTGYGALRDEIGDKKLKEAANPKHVAISLSGEPTIYPKISELVDEYHKKGLTTFVVSNGMLPEVISEMSLPTQLYISVEAPNREFHKKINAPLLKDSWERLNKTLELLPSLKTRKAIRITAIEGLNMSHEKEFAELIDKADVDYLELKSYMFVGFSRKRMNESNMPSHESVLNFAKRLESASNYTIKSESKPSRVVLMVRKEDINKSTKIKFDDD